MKRFLLRYGRETAMTTILALSLFLPVAVQAAAPATAANALAQARAALDRGDLDAARPACLQRRRRLLELAMSERGEPRATGLARAGALAPEGHWVRPAAAGLALLDEGKVAGGGDREAARGRGRERFRKASSQAPRGRPARPGGCRGRSRGLQRRGRPRPRLHRGAARGRRSQARGGRLHRCLQRLQPRPRRPGPAGRGARRARRRAPLPRRQGGRLRRPGEGGGQVRLRAPTATGR